MSEFVTQQAKLYGHAEKCKVCRLKLETALAIFEEIVEHCKVK